LDKSRHFAPLPSNISALAVQIRLRERRLRLTPSPGLPLPSGRVKSAQKAGELIKITAMQRRK